MTTSQKRLGRKIWPACVILGLILVFFGKNVFPVNGNFIGGVDVATYFLWHAQFIKSQFLSGSIPLWNPYYYSGHPFLANPQTFVFYPATLLFVALPLPWAFNIDTLLHLYLAAMGMYFFVFLITESKGAGLVSAVAYSLSGYFMGTLYAGHLTMIHTAALLPWIFYFSEEGCRTERMRFFLIAGAVFGLQILSGEPQNNYYTALFVVIYLAIRYFSTARPLRPKALYRPAVSLAPIFIVALGVSAVQILPSLEFMSLSDRAEKTYQFAAAWSFPLQNFFTFLIPKPPSSLVDWSLSGYFGVLAVILAGIGAGSFRYRPHAWCFIIMALIAVTIMLGSYTPIYHLYYKWLPGISTFRIPFRCIVIFVFSMTVLAGFGVRHICEATTRKQYLITMIWPGILLLCLFGGAAALRIPRTCREMVTAVNLFICAFVILNLNRFLKNKAIVVGLVIVALFVDSYLIHSPNTPVINRDQILKARPYESSFEKNCGLYRVASFLDLLHGMNFHYYGVNAYTPIALGRYYRFMHEMANVPVPKSARHVLNPQIFRPDRVFSSKVLGIKYAIIESEAGYELMTAQRVMPRAVLVGDAIVLPRPQDQLQYIKRPDFDPQQQVLLETAPDKDAQPAPEVTEAPAKENNVIITSYQPNRIELKAVSDSDTYLVLSELFYPGWHAYVDGNKVRILRANYLLRAIPLTAGRHNIIFVYRPASFIAGAAVSIFTLLALGYICVAQHRKKLAKRN